MIAIADAEMLASGRPGVRAGRGRLPRHAAVDQLMPRAPAAREVVVRLLAGVDEGPSAALAELYAWDALVELPFAGPSGLRIEGREALGAHFERAGQLPSRLVYENLVVHETNNPEVVVAEYDYRVESATRTTRTANVQIVTVRDGLIVRSRDFHHHASLAATIGAA